MQMFTKFGTCSMMVRSLNEVVERVGITAPRQFIKQLTVQCQLNTDWQIN